MPKRCIICGGKANFTIKDSSEFYCEDCAEEQFADISYLQRVEEQAQKIKEIVEEKIQ